MARKLHGDNSPGWRIGLLEDPVFACLALGLALAVREATASGASTREIHIQNSRFDPPAVEVPVGATVTGVNEEPGGAEGTRR